LILGRAGRRLSQTAQAAIESETTRLFMSVVSTWELYIKNAVGKLPLPDPVPTFVARVRDAYDIEVIDLTEVDLAPLVGLPLHHKDPFDHALLAQSIARSFVLITPDAMLRRYEQAQVLW